MKIGIDASRATGHNKTGVEWYAFYLLQELKKVIPPDVEVVLYSRETLDDELSDLPSNWTSKVLKWPPCRFWTHIRLSFELFRHPVDVLFVPAHVVPLYHPKKTVMTIHDIAAWRYPYVFSWFERWYSLWFSRYAMQKLWQVIVPSSFTKKELIDYTNSQKIDKVSVVAHGYDTNYRVIENQNKILEICKKYQITQPFIISVGRLEEKKNTLGILEAYKLFRDQNSDQTSQLLLIGKPGYGYEEIKSVLKSHPYKNDIVVPGWVEQEDLPYIMNAASCLLYPSFYEGFGLPALEAAACGIPVITSKNLSMDELIGEAGIYVDPKDSNEIAAAIKTSFDGGEDIENKVALGLKKVKEFSWNMCARDTFGILNK